MLGTRDPGRFSGTQPGGMAPARRKPQRGPAPGRSHTSTILATFYAAMALAGYAVEIHFGALGIIPTDRNVAAITSGPTLSYTAVLNIIFLALATVLVVRFLRTGGPAMLRMMSKPEGGMGGHDDQDASEMAGHGGQAMG